MSLAPNSVIGLLGGGQLGRLLANAASGLGLRTHIYAPEANCPAKDVAFAQTMADYDDAAALSAFARSVDVITYEFENVPAQTVEILKTAGAEVAPGGKALAVAQDRLVEKQFIETIGAKTAPYYPVDDLTSLQKGLDQVGRPAILKTRRLGYDGKGQTTLRANTDDLGETWETAKEKAWREIGARPAILEAMIDFTCEISIIGARGRNGEIVLFEPSENYHEGGILRRSTAPANISAETAAKAAAITSTLLKALDYVGVVGVEFFVLKDGDVLVNEFAPRVHNSGHWTADACVTSQFEQHIRAIAGWPLGDPKRLVPCVMENLIGAEADDWANHAREAGARLYLYGKDKTLPGRKMGHITRLGAQ